MNLYQDEHEIKCIKSEQRKIMLAAVIKNAQFQASLARDAKDYRQEQLKQEAIIVDFLRNEIL